VSQSITKPIVTLRQANLTLGNGASSVHVLKGIDIDINRGESVGIVGPSGSGKSTLLMVIAGLERLDSGEVHVADQALHALSEDAVAAVRGRSVGIVFQSFHLIPNMTALENVAVPLELAGKSNAFDRARENWSRSASASG
jgi:putative ABC transport system ATP-binding protein